MVFYVACHNGDSARVEQMLRENPEFLNHKNEDQQDGFGMTGLMYAAKNDSIETLKCLLSKKEVDLGIQDKDGWTAIIFAIVSNSVDCLRLLLQHPNCNQSILELKTARGIPAQMFANSNSKCKQLLKSFTNPLNSLLEKLQIDTQNKSFSVLMNAKPASDLSLEELVSEVKSLTSVQQEKEDIISKHEEKEKKEIEKFDNKLQKIEAEHKRKLQTIEIEYEERKTEHNKDLLKTQASYRKERQLIEDMFSKGEARKQELQDIIQGSFGMVICPSPHSQARTTLSAVPECYSCFEKYRPIVKLWTCGCGHSVCGNCYDRMTTKTCGQCRGPITGRATDLEKIIMSLYDLN